MNDKKDINQMIEEQFLKLPKEVRSAITDTNLIQKTKDLATKYSLHIDQLGSLQNEIVFVMIGLEPSSVFVENIINELKIDTEQANLIANDVNETIFKPIRTYLREWEENAEKEAEKNTTENIAEAKTNKSISDLERIGGFNIEPKQGSDDQGTEHIESRDRLINSIENPPAVEINTATGTQHNTEPFIDHLLAGPVVTVEQKTVQTASQKVSAPATSKIPTKPSGTDLYREPIQ